MVSMSKRSSSPLAQYVESDGVKKVSINKFNQLQLQMPLEFAWSWLEFDGAITPRTPSRLYGIPDCFGVGND